MSTPDLSAPLCDGAQQLGLALQPEQTQRLLAYLQLLARWNRVYNLTAVRQLPDMLNQHVLDSLAAWAALQRARLGGVWPQAADAPLAYDPVAQPLGPGPAAPLRVLDVGAGGGLPSVVWAVMAPPGWQIDAVDAVAKKAAFIQNVAVQLRLPQLRGLHARVQDLSGHYDLITSRALASLRDFTDWSRPRLAEGGCWLALKGQHPQAEIDALDAQQVDVFHVEPLQVPGLDAQRCLVWMRPQAQTAGADLGAGLGVH